MAAVAERVGCRFLIHGRLGTGRIFPFHSEIDWRAAVWGRAGGVASGTLLDLGRLNSDGGARDRP